MSTEVEEKKEKTAVEKYVKRAKKVYKKVNKGEMHPDDGIAKLLDITLDYIETAADDVEAAAQRQEFIDGIEKYRKKINDNTEGVIGDDEDDDMDNLPGTPYADFGYQSRFAGQYGN